MRNQTIVVRRKDSFADLRGQVETGTLVSWAKGSGYIVVKFDGGKYWSGRGMQAYSPAHFTTYKVFEVIESEDSVMFPNAQRVIETPLRAVPLDLSAS